VYIYVYIYMYVYIYVYIWGGWGSLAVVKATHLGEGKL